MDRRSFLSSTAATTAAIAAFPRLSRGAVAKSAGDRILLGPKRISVSRLAAGTGTKGYGGSSNQTRKLGLGGVADLFQAAFDSGVTFWDSADQYGSHPHLKYALRRIAREKVTILTKTRATTAAQMRSDLDRFRRELGTSYIDILLLHYMTDGNWPEQRKAVMDVISEAREKGIIRTHGVSCHSVPALKAAANPWAEVVLARLNPAGVAMDAGVSTVVPVLRQLKAAGKGIIGMKIFGEGRLRDRATECLRFALTQDCLDCFTIGIENRGELSDLLAKIPAVSVSGK